MYKDLNLKGRDYFFSCDRENFWVFFVLILDTAGSVMSSSSSQFPSLYQQSHHQSNALGKSQHQSNAPVKSHQSNEISWFFQFCFWFLSILLGYKQIFVILLVIFLWYLQYFPKVFKMLKRLPNHRKKSTKIQKLFFLFFMDKRFHL